MGLISRKLFHIAFSHKPFRFKGIEHTHLIGFSRYLSYEIHSRFCKYMFLATLYEEINKLSMNREIEIWILLPECRDVDIR